MSRAKTLWLGAAAALLGIQAIPVDRSNPPVTGEVPAPPEVRRVLRQSCYDCHSHETRWPWYAWLAPASWLVAHDVHEAREHMNFSTWQLYTPEERREKLEEAWHEVEEGHMPLPYYLPLHPEAQLRHRDRELLRSWAEDGGR